MDVINYIFYRLYKHYKNDNPLSTAVLYLSMLELFIIYFIILMFNAIIFPEKIIFKEIFFDFGISQNLAKISAIVFAFTLKGINYLYYKSRVRKYETKFANHPINKWFKVWMLYIVSLFLFFFPILIFKLRHYFGF